MQKDKFLEIFNNCLLNKLIFKYVSDIHGVVTDKEIRKFRWSEVIRNPHVMAGNSYLNELKQHYADHSIYPFLTATFTGAIKCKCFETLKYLVDLVKPISKTEYRHEIQFNNILCCAAEYGSLEMVKYICTEFEKKRLNYYQALVKAPLSGDLEMIKYLHEKLENCDQTRLPISFEEGVSFDSAAKKGRIHMIEWLAENRSNDREESTMYGSAIEGGHLHVVQYLLDINEPLRVSPSLEYDSLFDYSIYCNQLEIAKLLYHNNIRESQVPLMDFAACHGNIEMLKWMKENTTIRGSDIVMDNAALGNHFEVLKWLHENLTESCRYTEVALWLLENQTSANEISISDAVIGGNLEIIKWLFANRTERPTTWAMECAAHLNHMHVIRWLHENIPNSITTDAMDSAARHGDITMLIWLHENRSEGCTGRALKNAISYNHFETMKWLKDNRTEISNLKQSDCQCTIEGFRLSIATGHMDMIEYLLEKHPEFANQQSEPDEFLKNFYSSGDDEMIEFLLDKINFPLDKLKVFHQSIDSDGYPEIPTKLLDDHIEKRSKQFE
ncbi:hypothetical protein PPL_11410 [Heterostelium album PN500]|uniref:Ankyrin repeat protein n=1 Tax=Heterostelium pallidum (strain ATCC 26659 / Pp 5 / PN500) TaxID=670386 RepID=D3BTB7_HETP5|nr:hypothetical protein PPL_11410 [Heterostelium album PN500]EFA75334.1 hypothetical protein PPL_11410 [Heterostelium album PN500]|eukprot:XP_020427468.1 hypothetical protein PPL_11410 [Heterostelium album PN500]